jgi:uncharacterized protein (DUF1330 family)
VKRQRMEEQEGDLNQEKLRMLVKFDQIKYLEDFHNQHIFMANLKAREDNSSTYISDFTTLRDLRMVQLDIQTPPH